MALPHRVAERIIMASGMTWTILRNGVYAEILGAPLSWERQQEEPARIVSPLGDGAVAVVARQDLARAAASVLSDPGGNERKVYELVGSRAVSAADVAGRLACEVRDMSLGEYRQLLVGGGMPAFRLSLMLSIASVIRHGSWPERVATSPVCWMGIPWIRSLSQPRLWLPGARSYLRPRVRGVEGTNRRPTLRTRGRPRCRGRTAGAA